MNITILDAETLGHDLNLNIFQELGNLQIYATTSPDQIISRCINAEIIITNKVILNAEILGKLPQLNLICVAATGTNNIDLAYCSQNNIQVKNAVDYSTNSVAQHTFTCLLALLSNISYYDKYVKNSEYSKSSIFTHLDFPYEEISGKTLGILGMGNIGRKVADIAAAFGAAVIYSSVSGATREEKYKQTSLEYLLSNSDIVSIHSPLTDKTKNLITQRELNLMKPNSILINMGRGGIVNEIDLHNALTNNQIAGACVDVFEKEPITKDNVLLDSKIAHKLILTPHIAWASVEARKKLVNIIYEHIKLYKSTKS